MSEIFLHIDSTFRDRITYPDTSEFQVKTDDGVFQDGYDTVLKGFPHYSEVVVSSSSGTVYNGQTATRVEATSFFSGKYLYNNTVQPTKILFIDHISNTSTFIYVAGTISIILGDTIYISEEKPILSTTVSAGSTTSSIAMTSINNDIYIGMWLRVVFSPTDIQLRLITGYTSGTLTVTVSTPFTTTPGVGNNVYISNSTEHVYNPLSFNDIYRNTTGYEVKLLYITIPSNKYISNGYNGTISDYPFLSVNIGRSETFNMYTNNPHSKNDQFILSNIGNNENNWISYTSYMTQVIRFKLGETLNFSVKLPNGAPIKFNQPDNASPLPPNPLLQINAVFSFRRLNM
jgi:hypothetical protein